MRFSAYVNIRINRLHCAFFLRGFMRISAYQCFSLHQRLRKKSAVPILVTTPVSWSLEIVCDGLGGLQNNQYFSLMVQNSQDEPKRVHNGQKHLF